MQTVTDEADTVTCRKINRSEEQNNASKQRSEGTFNGETTPDEESMALTSASSSTSINVQPISANKEQQSNKNYVSNEQQRPR